MHSAPPVRDRVIGLIHDGSHRIALDLTKVDFMDSSSLGVLVTCLKRARERDGRLVLVGVSGSPMKVLSLTGLDRVFELVDGVDELPSD
jgi:anti-sigma B factor antagonist